MSSATVVRLDIEVERDAPRVFTRVISTPPGMPWDQTRAATLETRIGAPLPISEVAWRLRRLDPWSPGRPGRFAAVYLRIADVGAGLTVSPEVEGRVITVRFLSFAEQKRQATRALIGAVAIAGLLALIVGGIALALRARARTEVELAQGEATAARQLKKAEDLAQLKRQSRVLQAERLSGLQLGDLVQDLNWAASAKTPAAQFEGVHWDHGFMAVEVRGDAPAFFRLDRPVQKSVRPARAGVWLWGVSPHGPSRP